MARDRLEVGEVLRRVERGWRGRLAADGRPLLQHAEPPVVFVLLLSADRPADPADAA